jgi:GNAT superfamily N-acetyltransferase
VTVTSTPIVQVPERDRARAISTIVAAFVNDPVERWLFPELARYQARFGEFVAAFAGEAFDQRSVWTLGDFHAVALWLAPGAGVDEAAIADVLTDAVAAERHEDLFSVLEQMDRAHPAFAHWYLPWLGVLPDAQGQGLGGQLLEHGLAMVDRTHLPAFLETPNRRTVALYERHGFVVTSESQSGACPPVISMVREAR